MSISGSLKRLGGVFLNYASLLTRLTPPSPVGYIIIEANGICNLRCKMCNIGELSADTSFRRDELTPQAWAEIFRNSRLLKLMPKVRITGGEPFIRRDLPDLITMLLDIPHIEEVAAYTNGSLTERVIHGVKGVLERCPAHKRLEVGVSLDDVGERHDRIRGKRGAFKAAWATVIGLKELKEQHPNLEIHSGTVIQPDNVMWIEEIDKLRRGIGIKSHYMLIQNTAFFGNRDGPYGPHLLKSPRSDPSLEAIMRW